MNATNFTNRASEAQCFADAARLAVDCARLDSNLCVENINEANFIESIECSEDVNRTSSPMNFTKSFIEKSEQYFAAQTWQSKPEYRNNSTIATISSEVTVPA